ncbi:protein NETWORKED 4B-like [Vicia villosa]|uniref:protein NETWORKED 4B-like n=1 Tax=Vicia villosa TaxID=3911 RepID=UPI00273C2146|nr:protein NETWORKED 4B-like [Vicia villosa]
MIPNQKTLNIDLPSSSNVDVSSMKEGCESPMSSWDSEPEADISSIMSEKSLQDINLEGNILDREEQHHFVGVENMDDGFSGKMDNKSYDELLKKFIEKEEELRVSNLKLQLLEQENIKLAGQVENSVIQVDDVSEKLKLKEHELYEQKKLLGDEISKLMIQNLKCENQLDDVRGELNVKEGQLNDVHGELKLKKKEMNEQNEISKEVAFKLKNQIKECENQLDNVRGELNMKKKELQKRSVELGTRISEFVNKNTILRTRISESVNKNKNLMKQLEAADKKLKISTEEIAILQEELGSKSSMILQVECHIKEEKKNVEILKAEIETLVRKNEENVINHQEELRKLISILFDLQAKRRYLNSDVESLSRQKQQLTSKLENCESKNKELEQKIKQYDAENLKQKKLHSTQLMLLQDEISYLRKKRVDERMNDVEASNKESEKVMIEIDEANVKIDKLKAEICSCDDQISHMKNTSRKGLMVDYRGKLNEEDKLKLKVEELEKEVTNKNGVILEMTEEKKEAIRQLCDSLEHYRSGYSELIQALNGL